jgi:hypothetical protein
LKNFRGGREIFLACFGVLWNIKPVSTSKHADGRADLDASRDVSEPDKQGYGFLLAWFETWRTRKQLSAGRPAAVAFWQEQVVVKPLTGMFAGWRR